MKRLCMLAAMAVLSLGGCASITAGTTQSVAVDTSPQKVAECQLVNEKGSWTVPRTPGSTTVNKAYGPLTVTCSTAQGHTGSSAVESTTAGAAFGNIIAGGIIGAAVDMSSGAAYTYPAQIVVPIHLPEPETPATPTVKTAPGAPPSSATPATEVTAVPTS